MVQSKNQALVLDPGIFAISSAVPRIKCYSTLRILTLQMHILKNTKLLNSLGIAKAQCSRLKQQGLKEHSSASTVAQQKFPQLHWHRRSWQCPVTMTPNHISHFTWAWGPGWNNTATPQPELNPALQKPCIKLKGKTETPWKEMAAFFKRFGIRTAEYSDDMGSSVMNLNNTC